jgi:L1 cell adhesion molecule like protein
MPRGTPQIEITYEVDVNGILNVSACEKSSGKSEKITIKNDSSRLSAAEIEAMISNAEKFKDEDEKAQQRMDAKNKLENYVYNIKSTVLGEEKMKTALGDDVDLVTSTVEDTIKWLEQNTSATTEEFSTKETEVETILKPLVEKAYAVNMPPGGTSGMPPGGMPEGMSGMPVPGGVSGMPPGGMSDMPVPGGVSGMPGNMSDMPGNMSDMPSGMPDMPVSPPLPPLQTEIAVD